MHTMDLGRSATKEERYRALVPQIKALTESEPDVTANMANVAAALKEAFGFWWVGFYVVKGDMLVLGPFQGPVACTRIAYGKGVCGTAWAAGETQTVPDVTLFPGHIACSSLSRSEVVLPVRQRGTVVAVLDIDSDRIDAFDHVDRRYLEEIVSFLDF